MVSKKPEKRTPRDPVEESEAPGHGTAEGKHEQDLEPGLSVNETSPDSRTGVRDERSEPVSRGAGCGSPARPDLRGAGASNRLGLPDQFATRCTALHSRQPACRCGFGTRDRPCSLR